jgi:preprotein translocase subunit SecY
MQQSRFFLLFSRFFLLFWRGKVKGKMKGKKALEDCIRINTIGYMVMSFIFFVWMCVCFYEMLENMMR